MASRSVLITKASGEQAPFSEQKIRQSLSRSGADEETISRVLQKIKPVLYDGISTRKIYRFAFDALRKISASTAARYKLKVAIMELGPSGFPFEKFVGEIMKSRGFSVQVGVTVPGRCVTHEIDVIAVKENNHYLIECKFHNSPGIQCDVKIPLYINSRFQDVEKYRTSIPGHDTQFHQPWVVTNTRFSGDAIQYGLCAGLHLLGWDYPPEGGLKEWIDNASLHPITCLTSITQQEKNRLLEAGLVMCKDLVRNRGALLNARIPEARMQRVMREVEELGNLHRRPEKGSD